MVADQIRLWQQELHRLGSQPATMYRDFDSAELYARTAAHAEQLGAVLKRDDERRVLVVPAAFHDSMKAEIRQQKAALGLR